MSIIQKEPKTVSQATATIPRRWEGHMSDGIGATYGITPMAYLSADTNELLLVGSRGTFRLPRPAVRKVGRGGFYPWLFRGVRIRHNIAGYPDELVFRPMGVPEREVLDCLRTLGYGPASNA